jgi:drug/metabolite transporter (DMT)-like permease
MSRRVVIATVCLVAALIGGNFTALKFALDHTTPLLLAGLRTVIGGSFLLAFALLRGERLPRRTDDLANIFVVSLAITTVSSGLLVYGTSRVPAGVASLLSSTAPLFTAVLSAVLLSVGVTRAGGVGLLLGFAGTIVLASPSLGGETAAIGILALAGSALAWAFGLVYMKWRDFSRVNPVMLVGVQLVMSACVLVPLALVLEGTAYLIPVFGVFFGWLLRDEVMGAVEMLGGVLVAAGVFVVVTAAARRAERTTTLVTTASARRAGSTSSR